MTKHNKHYIELIKDILFYGVMEGVSRLSGFLLLPLFARLFSTDQYGTIDIVAVVKSLLATLICLSLSNATQRYFYDDEACKNKKAFITSMSCAVVATGILSLICGYIFLAPITKILLGNSDKELFITLAFISAFFDGLTRIPQMILRMERRIIGFNLTNLLQSVLYAGLSIFFIYVLKVGLISVFIALCISDAFKLLFSLYLTKEQYSFSFSIPALVRSLKFSLPILPADILNWLNTQVDRLILLTYVGLSGVGIFGAAARIGLLVKLPGQIFHQAWAPYAMTLIGSPVEERNHFYTKILNYYVGCFVALCMLLIAISPECFRVILPIEYHRGYLLIPWICGAAIFEMSRGITGVGVAITERTHINTIAAVCSSIVNIVLGIALIRWFGILGGAIGSFVAQFIFTGLLGVFSFRYAKVPFQGSKILTVLGCYIITSVTLILITLKVSSPCLSLVLRGAVSFFAVGVVVHQIFLGLIKEKLPPALSTFKFTLSRKYRREFR